MKHRGLFFHRMDASDRHNGQRDDNRVRLYDGVWPIFSIPLPPLSISLPGKLFVRGTNDVLSRSAESSDKIRFCHGLRGVFAVSCCSLVWSWYNHFLIVHFSRGLFVIFIYLGQSSVLFWSHSPLSAVCDYRIPYVFVLSGKINKDRDNYSLRAQTTQKRGVWRNGKHMETAKEFAGQVTREV